MATDPTVLAQALVSGLAVGSAYGLVGAGFNLIYRTTGVINFAQGALAAFSAYLAWQLFAVNGWPGPIAVGVAILAAGLLFVVVERLLLRPLYPRGVLPPIIATIGLGSLVEGVILWIWGGQGKNMPTLVGDEPFDIVGLKVIPQDILMIAVGIALVLAARMFLNHTMAGVSMRATAQNSGVAELLGVRTGRMLSLSFLASGCFAGLAGVLIAPTTYLQPAMGITLGIAGFVGAAIGGFGSVEGGFIGGLLIGVVGNLVTLYLDPAWLDMVTYGLFATLLLIKPTGLFGEEGLDVRRV